MRKIILSLYKQTRFIELAASLVGVTQLKLSITFTALDF